VTSRFGLGDLKFADGRGTVSFYGQFNNGHVNADGEESDIYLATNAATLNKVGVRARYEMNNDLGIGGRLAIAAAYNRSDIKNDFNDEHGCDEEDNDRYFCAYDANIFLTSQSYGTITAGLGETAFAGIGSINLGGITFVTNNDPTLKAGGQIVPNTGVELNRIAPDVTGVERGTLIRYDSPTIAGFVLSASWGEADHVGAPAGSDSFYDVALRYAGEFGAIRVAAGVGYQDYDREGDSSQSNFGVGGSVLHTPTGLYVSGSYNSLGRDAPGAVPAGATDNADAWYSQVGIRQNWLSLGKTTLYAEYGKTESGADDGGYFIEDSKTRNFGLGVVQNIDRAAMSLYVTYNNIDAESSGTSGDVNVVMAGGRIKF
jgi:hypothetical protein